MEFVLIRHTACDIEPGVCYGRLDVPLRSSAAEDIERTLRSVPGVSAIFASPSQRCDRLARRLAQRDACELTLLPELRELDFGAWEGLHWNDVPRELSDRWADDPWNRAPPDGETEAQLFERVERAYHRIASCGVARIAIVAHGGPLRLMRCLILGLPASERWSWSIATGEAHRIAR